MRPRSRICRGLVLLGCSQAVAVHAQRTKVVHLTPGDSVGNVYRAYAPDSPARGLLVLLPGAGDRVHAFSPGGSLQATLPDRMAEQGVVTIVAVPAMETLYVDDTTVRLLDGIVADALRRYHIPVDRVVVGGFSSGGTGALRYAELCAAQGCRAGPGPRGVFAVDSPLDLERLYRSIAPAAQRKGRGVDPAGARRFLGLMAGLLGGSPDDKPVAYRRASVFSASTPDGGNARLLSGIPVRLYSEPDVQWYIENANVGYFGMNATDHSGLISLLRMRGNRAAELITTAGRGHRPNGERYPHSWSIVDEPDLAGWVLARMFGTPAAP
jgi:hypothetical protein